MLKTVSKNIVKFIPKKEIGSEKPTTVCYLPLSKGAYDLYSSTLVETKGRKVISKMDKAASKLFEVALAPDENGVFIYNAVIDGVETTTIKTKDEAIKFLMALDDIDTATEIEKHILGRSTLDEDEEKNSITP